MDILRLARELKVEFAFPTQTLYVRREEPGHPDNPADVAEALGLGRRSGARIGRAGARQASTESLPPAMASGEFDLEQVMAERTGGEG
jgi:hypothetical protein